MLGAGLEPACLSARDFKSLVATITPPERIIFLHKAARRIACFNLRIKSRKRDYQITNYRVIRERMLSESDPIETSILPQLCREKSILIVEAKMLSVKCE